MSEIQNVVDTVYGLNKNEQYDIIHYITSLISDEEKFKQENINKWRYQFVSHVDWILNLGYRESFPKVPEHLLEKEFPESIEKEFLKSIKKAVKDAMENVYIPPEYGVNPSIRVKVNRIKKDFLVQHSINMFFEKICGFNVCAMDYIWYDILQCQIIKNTVKDLENEQK